MPRYAASLQHDIISSHNDNAAQEVNMQPYTCMASAAAAQEVNRATTVMPETHATKPQSKLNPSVERDRGCMVHGIVHGAWCVVYGIVLSETEDVWCMV